MTHADLVEIAGRWLRGTRRCALVATERSCQKAAESPDAIGWLADGGSILVECKASLADLRADRRKPHRQGAGMGRERWFLAQDGVLPATEIPPGWGLLVFRSGRVYRTIHAALRDDVAAEVARIEQPLLVALARRHLFGAVNGVTLGDVDVERDAPAGAATAGQGAEASSPQSPTSEEP